ncbi:SpaH/EbpB family LPXTG-anchored major pilin [Arthrobacter sp. FW306-2-2C-D06B]|uniref:SpaH/EbpB family LPXTG-anchored major pilin n=1 Tax=Arthrobacter sp. FW306-2-2C-D06B TaxID=2879618 RepID=UPI001F2D4E37|nr:SpaH/EbpB family LPXTG-anchored major pilin [Arthrobacter sp. FW306-2-2C-D06B]UKA58949.1 SpaH/EbpB family LPXTG-anchored major pilin [Arthrobacter sp. FW306-2-2C-D06B]
MGQVSEDGSTGGDASLDVGHSDPHIMAMVRDGDASAFDELFRRHVAAAQFVARAQTDNVSDADDVVSEAFASIFQALTEGKGPDQFFRSYLLTAVRRIAYDRNRKARRTQVVGDVDVLDTVAMDADTVLDAFESTTMAKAFRSLPERWQAALWHVDIEGLKPAAAAPFIGLSPNGVSSLVIRAREGLRQAYLQNHVTVVSDDSCAEFSSQLGKYARDGLKRASREKVRAHLEECPKCTAVLVELNDVQAGMRALVFPLVVGVVFTPAAAAGFLPGTAMLETLLSGGVLPEPFLPEQFVTGGAEPAAAELRSVGGFWKIAVAALVLGGLVIAGILMWLGQTSPAPIAEADVPSIAPSAPQSAPERAPTAPPPSPVPTPDPPAIAVPRPLAPVPIAPEAAPMPQATVRVADPGTGITTPIPRTGSLTIHKYEKPATPTGLPHDGMALTAAQLEGMTPMAGVTFTVQKVNNIDLTTNAGWAAAAALTPAQAAAQAATPGSTATTDASGTATLGNLPLGLYLVTETGYPAGVTPSAPFLVTLPMTDPAGGNGWIYDVNVYPKNAVTTATKTVNDASVVKLGDNVQWTITSDIPNVNPIDGYRIVDKLDSKLSYANSAVALSNNAALVLDTDYTVVFDTASNTLMIDFTASGRAILAANPTAKVLVTVNSTVSTVGEIANTALVYPNAASFAITPGQPGGPVLTPPVSTTKWGDIVLHKKDSQSSAALSGAVFSVYPSRADALAGTKAISVGGVSSWTTDASGNLVISGLRYSNWANGKPVGPGQPGYQSYWLVETKAPAGYELLAQPVETAVTSNDPSAVTVTIGNIKQNTGFQLPLTGAGTWPLTAGGILVLAGAGLFMATGRRKPAEAK